MILRPAQTRDAAAITALWNALIRDTLFTFTTDERLFSDTEALISARHDAFWVAEVDGGLAGFVTYGPFRAGPGYSATVEHTIILDPSARGQGVGRALLEYAMTAAQNNGIHTMVAGISSANAQAQAFHAALGFRRVGHLPEVGRKHGIWLDLILMQKTFAVS